MPAISVWCAKAFCAAVALSFALLATISSSSTDTLQVRSATLTSPARTTCCNAATTFAAAPCSALPRSSTPLKPLTASSFCSKDTHEATEEPPDFPPETLSNSVSSCAVTPKPALSALYAVVGTPAVPSAGFSVRGAPKVTFSRGGYERSAGGFHRACSSRARRSARASSARTRAASSCTSWRHRASSARAREAQCTHMHSMSTTLLLGKRFRAHRQQKASKNQKRRPFKHTATHAAHEAKNSAVASGS
mmetsp:Transcript_10746/g.26084  ORF Transcript_10746/g.26084 Transcript_10746/m.26084 type:complete len:249 (+) Transcript_10746:4198-4944(+)